MNKLRQIHTPDNFAYKCMRTNNIKVANKTVRHELTLPKSECFMFTMGELTVTGTAPMFCFLFKIPEFHR